MPPRTETSKNIRCVVAHDHVLLRQGLRRLLEDEPDIAVVAEAGNAAEALRCVFEHRPEIVIVAPHIFKCDAEASERLILQESPKSNVLFLRADHHEMAVHPARGRSRVRGTAYFGGRIGEDGAGHGFRAIGGAGDAGGDGVARG